MKIRNLFYLVLIVFLSNNLLAQKTDRYVRAGIIPYQVCSRGPAAYWGKDGPKFSYEIRPSYTIATKWVTYVVPTKHDKYFFQGVNLGFLVRKNTWRLPKLLTGYRYWWYDKQKVHAEQATVSTASSYSRMEYKTKRKHGLIVGIELDHQFDFKHLDLNFFFNTGITLFEGKELKYKTDDKGIRSDEYQTSKVESAEFFMAFGLKIGFCKRINTN